MIGIHKQNTSDMAKGGRVSETQVTWGRGGYLKHKQHGEGGRVTERQATWQSKTIYNKKKYKENIWI